MNQIILELLRQKKLLLGIVLVLIVLNVALTVFVSTYQIPALAAVQTRWSDVRRQVAHSDTADAATLYRQGRADLERLNTKIPLKRDFARVLSDLIELASTSAVTMGSMSYKPAPAAQEGLLSYQLAFPVSGSYAAVKSYLADLQNYSELVVVDSISLANSDPYEELVVMDLHTTVYLRGMP